MRPFITSFLGAYYNMSEMDLNKFEKEKRVIEFIQKWENYSRNF